MDVSTPHYEKKVNDLEKRLETQYDKIYEIEESISDLKAQIRELKKDQVDADSIYEFLFGIIPLEKLTTVESVVLMSRA